MEAKLIKINGEYLLNPSIVGTKLSIKNCQAIENGYDLDELALKFMIDESYGEQSTDLWKGYLFGFQKALSILGDKKFSEKDVYLAINLAWDEDNLTTIDIIQELQQTEWDVEIEMICPHPMDTYRCGLKYGCDGDGCNHPEQVPYLDADGCLILKRK